MELTPKQIESIKLLYGEENIDDADYIIDLLRKKKNKDFLTKQFYYYSKPYWNIELKKKSSNFEKILEKKLFDKEGNINYTIEEFEQWLNHPIKGIISKDDSEYTESINQHFKQIKELIKKLQSFESIELLYDEVRLLSKSIKRRKKVLLNKEISRIDKSIEYLQGKKEQLEQNNFIELNIEKGL